MKQEPIEITGVHLYRVGDRAKVAVEVDGHWVVVIAEIIDSPFSHIVESLGIRSAMERTREVGR